MSKVIIGSIALAYHLPSVRAPNDYDIVCNYETMRKTLKNQKVKSTYPINSGEKQVAFLVDGRIFEIEIAWPESLSEEFIKLVEQDSSTIIYEDGNLLPSLNVLYMLKMSHRYKKNSPHFLKTMEDIHLMRRYGAKLLTEGEWFEWYNKRVAATYNYSHPSLKRSKDDFFSGDGIVYKYCHDSLHEAVKHFDKPAYTYFSDGEVWSDMNKFKTLPEEIKLYAVLEESLVLAAERSQLAFPEKDIKPVESFEMALMKVCTSITSGVFREYAWENYYEVLDLYHSVGYNYMQRIHKGIKEGVVYEI